MWINSTWTKRILSIQSLEPSKTRSSFPYHCIVPIQVKTMITCDRVYWVRYSIMTCVHTTLTLWVQWHKFGQQQTFIIHCQTKLVLSTILKWCLLNLSLEMKRTKTYSWHENNKLIDGTQCQFPQHGMFWSEKLQNIRNGSKVYTEIQYVVINYRNHSVILIPQTKAAA